ncbi:hypothetical protein SLA2020_428200 [Shorea laevis]
MEARARVMRPLRQAMNVKMGSCGRQIKEIVAKRNRKAIMKTARGTRSLGSTSCESKHAMMEEMRVNIRKAVATNSVRAPLHI